MSSWSFPFFHNCGPMIFAIKLRIAGTDLGIKRPSHHPAPLSAALVKVDRSVNRSRWTEGLLVQSGRTAGRLWRTPEGEREGDPANCCGPPTQPETRHSPRSVAAGKCGVQTAWPHFIVVNHSRQERKLLLLATSDGACCIRPKQNR